MSGERRGARAWRALVVAAGLLAGVAQAQSSPDEVLQRGDEALRRGALREALEVYEAFADRGGQHPDVSYSRGVAYLARTREGSGKPGDLGRAAAAFEEALRLRPDDADAALALERVRSEVARRRSRSGVAMEVDVSPGALRALSGLFAENTWASLALAGSLALALGLGLRRTKGPWRLVSGVALGLGGLLLLAAGPMTAYRQYLRRQVGTGVVVVDEARVVDERGVPVAGKIIPEAARVDVHERQGALVRVKWGTLEGLIPSSAVRLIVAPRP